MKTGKTKQRVTRVLSWMLALSLCLAAPFTTYAAEDADADTSVVEEADSAWKEPLEEVEIELEATEELIVEEAYDTNGFPQELLNKSGIVVTATGVSEDDYYYRINLKVQNNSGQNIIVQARKAAINSLMIWPSMSINVTNGKTAIDELSFSKSNLAASEISTVGEVVFDLHICDAETYNNLFEDTPAQITVNAGVHQQVNPGSQVLYDRNGMKIVLKGLENQSGNAYVYEENVILYIENNTNQTLGVQTRNTSVNDIMLEPSMSEDIRPGCKVFAKMSFSKTRMEEKGISSIDKVETQFHVFNSDNWLDVFTTESVTFYPVLLPATGSTGSSVPPVVPTPTILGVRTSGWRQLGDEWYFYDDAGNKMTGWIQVGRTWYFMDASGVMQTGWIQTGGVWYYLQPSGAMAIGWVDDNGTWYYMDSTGAMQTGWLFTGGAWYYLRSSGAMATGWEKVGNTWYYMNSSGVMQTGWVDDHGTWYYMDSNGAMKTGWVDYNGTWYYMRSSGEMATGWVDDNGTWYYMDNSGVMKTGWVQSGSSWYYLSSSGSMLTNTSITDGGTTYYFNASGACTNP